MRLAHVSDLHLGMREIAPGGGRPAAEVAEAVARDLAGISEAVDLVIVSGDLTERADAAAFADFERMFSEIGLPVVIVPGNHDGPAGMRAYTASSEVFADWNITNRVKEFGGMRCLGLDTCIEGAVEGELDEEGLALVAEEVARDGGEGSLLIVMHHPPLLLGLDKFDGFCRLKGHERLMDILRGSGMTIKILSGHVHRPFFASEHNIDCYVAGSMVAPYDSALPFGDHPIRPTMLQDFYYLHDFGPGGRHLVTPQRVRGLAR
ncbi:MAG: metallophosphoesterase [Silicimonas sp.]|nr:metallophosphoesterase [Silicimonas sp.]